MKITHKVLEIQQPRPKPLQRRVISIHNLTPRLAAALAAVVNRVRKGGGNIGEFSEDLEELAGRFSGAGVPPYNTPAITGMYDNPEVGMPRVSYTPDTEVQRAARHYATQHNPYERPLSFPVSALPPASSLSLSQLLADLKGIPSDRGYTGPSQLPEDLLAGDEDEN